MSREALSAVLFDSNKTGMLFAQRLHVVSVNFSNMVVSGAHFYDGKLVMGGCGMGIRHPAEAG